jgi:hypothetical protein
MLAVFLFASAAAAAQNQATATGTAGAVTELPFGGTLRYDLHLSQTFQFGSGQNGQESSYISGDASYSNTAKLLPFSMQYGGGYGRNWNVSNSGGNVFQHLSLSQGLVWRKWSLTASDNVSETFQTSTTGFTGVPGTGEPVGTTGSTTTPDQTLLVLDTRTVSNSTMLGFSDRLNSKYSINLDGSESEMRLIDNNGLNSNSLAASGGITRRLGGRSSLSSQYSYSRYSYGGSSFSAQTSSLTAGFARMWSRRLSTSVNVGPLWVSSSGTAPTVNASTSGTPANGASVPSSTMLSLTATVSYQLRRGTAGANYFHGMTGGSGYMLGSKVDSLGTNYSRPFGRNLTVGATGSYLRTTSLEEILVPLADGNWFVYAPATIDGVTNAKFGGVQATRQLGRRLSLFANYTAIAQSSSLQIAKTGYSANLLQGVNQVFGFGIGYTPREMHFKK